MAFHVTTSVHSVHKRRHLQKEKCGLTFPTYHMLSGFLCVHTPRLGVWNELNETVVDLCFYFISQKIQADTLHSSCSSRICSLHLHLPCKPSTCCLDAVYVQLHSINCSFPLQPPNVTFHFCTREESYNEMTAPSNTHSLRPCETLNWYCVQIVWERQLWICQSYFVLLLLKKSSTLTRRTRHSTFKHP